MSPLSKLTIGIIVVCLAAFALAAQFIHVREVVTSNTLYTSNAGQLVGDMLVGQNFIAEKNDLSGIGVLMATYSNRKNEGVVEFHLRSWEDTSRDLRVASVDASALKDNQVHKFIFEPIPDSAGKTYFFYVTAPHSVLGKAVTVDLDSRDPYHRGTAFIVRGKGNESTTPAVLAESGKVTADLSFETYHSVILRDALVHKTVSTVRYIIGTWPEKQGQYELFGQVLGQVLLVLAAAIITWRSVYEFLVRMWGERKVTIIFLSVFLVAGLGFRIVYAWSLPVTYDEGNYLYDARTWLQGNLAGGDGYVKSPAVIAWVSAWQLILGNTVLAGRMASLVVAALTMYPIYFFSKELFATFNGRLDRNDVGRRMALMAAALWAVAGTAVVGGIYVHTQPLALFFGVAGLAVLAMALRGSTPHLTFLAGEKTPSATGWFILSGILLGLGVASRKSILALGLVPLLLILVQGKSWQFKVKHVVAVGIGFAAVIALFIGFAWWLYGPVGIQEAIGINSAEDGITAVDPAEKEQVRAYSLRGMTPFFRESLPIILLLSLGIGFAAEQLIRAFFRVKLPKPDKWLAILADHVVPKLGWIFALGVFWWAWGFFSEYEGQAFMFWGIPVMWYVFLAIIIIALLLPRRVEEAIVWAQPESSGELTFAHSHQPVLGSVHTTEVAPANLLGVKDYAVTFLLPILWAGGLAFFYMNWIKFHANYISEFIPPLIIVAGAGMVALFDRIRLPVFFDKDYPVLDLGYRVSLGILLFILGWSFYTSDYITYVYEHTGSYDQGTLRQAAVWAKQYIPQNEPIFTGAAVIPYLSGHHTALDIAHPRWYAYEFTRTNVKRFETFLPSVSEMNEAFDRAQWFLYDEQTRFSFFQEYDRIKNEVDANFVKVKDFDNGLVFYQRVR